MLFAHLRAAHARALQTAALNERSGKMPLGTLEGRPRARQIQRLFVAAAGVELLHARHDLRRIIRVQLKFGFQHNAAHTQRQRAAV